MGFTQYRRKQHMNLRRVLSRMGRTELAAQLLAKQHAWAGHLARLDEAHLAAQWASSFSLEQWRLQQAIGMAFDKSGVKTRWRHCKRGPITRWDNLFCRVEGLGWRSTAQDRTAWKRARRRFVQEAANQLFGAGHRMFGVEDGASMVAQEL